MLALFGKLPARRDFIARNVPNPVLERLEPWLQEAVAQSRETLGPAWLNAFLTAPLWRFWLSRSLLGAGVAGVIMPSVDQVGRYFPLTAFAIAAEGTDHAPPEQSHEAWYGALETALLGALSQDTALQNLVDALNTAPPPPPPVADAPAGSLWWTIGGPDHPPRRAAYPAMPPPYAFTQMLRAETAPAASQ
ncbi:MAG: type VI secretion system-associated protein TagF [Pseudomonadota bacterium]